ncbi:MAG: tripartite-type tricarboxylate transporter receptor subunit TctC [Alphaproteobacteria bacterium]|jgi:tripartite-type tricarboxylate transporter receptor subunit TctC
MNSIKLLTAAMIGTFVGSSIFSAPVSADAVSDFYKKTRLKLVIGYAPGGGFDRGGRVVARHIVKHIPGKPSVIVQNMPGAGSMRSLNWLYNKGPKDGSVLGHFHISAMREAYIGAAGALFDPRKFYWLGSYTKGSSVLFVRADSGVKTIQDAMKTQVIVGATSPRSGSGAYPLILNQVLGTKFKVVVGYGTTGEGTLAMERGELQGYGAWAWTQLKDRKPKWFKDKFVNVLVNLSVARRDDLPGIPTAVEVAKTDGDKKVLNALLTWELLGRPFVSPPGTDPVRGKALRQAFKAMVETESFKKEIAKASFDVDPILGEAAKKLLDDVYAYPKEITNRARIVFSEMRSIKVAKAKLKKANGLTVSGIKGKGRKMRISFKDSNGKAWKFKTPDKRLSRKTKINGKKAKANQIKKGMVCAVTYYGKGGLAYSANCEG